MFEATSDQQSQSSVIVVSNNSVVVGGGVNVSTNGGVVNTASVVVPNDGCNDTVSSVVASSVVDGFSALNEVLADAISASGAECQRLNILSSYYYCIPLNHSLNLLKHINSSTNNNNTSSSSCSSSSSSSSSNHFDNNTTIQSKLNKIALANLNCKNDNLLNDKHESGYVNCNHNINRKEDNQISNSDSTDSLSKPSSAITTTKLSVLSIHLQTNETKPDVENNTEKKPVLNNNNQDSSINAQNVNTNHDNQTNELLVEEPHHLNQEECETINSSLVNLLNESSNLSKYKSVRSKKKLIKLKKNNKNKRLFNSNNKNTTSNNDTFCNNNNKLKSSNSKLMSNSNQNKTKNNIKSNTLRSLLKTSNNCLNRFKNLMFKNHLNNNDNSTYNKLLDKAAAAVIELDSNQQSLEAATTTNDSTVPNNTINNELPFTIKKRYLLNKLQSKHHKKINNSFTTSSNLLTNGTTSNHSKNDKKRKNILKLIKFNRKKKCKTVENTESSTKTSTHVEKTIYNSSINSTEFVNTNTTTITNNLNTSQTNAYLMPTTLNDTSHSIIEDTFVTNNQFTNHLELTQQLNHNYQQSFCYDIEMMPPPNNITSTSTSHLNTNQYFFDDATNTLNRNSILINTTNTLGIQTQIKQDLLKISFEKFKQFRLNEKLLQQTVLIRNAIKMLQYDIQFQQEQEQILLNQQMQQQQQQHHHHHQQQLMDYTLNDSNKLLSSNSISSNPINTNNNNNITMSTYENLDEFLSRSEFINNNLLNVNNSLHNKNTNGIGFYFLNMDAQENNTNSAITTPSLTCNNHDYNQNESSVVNNKNEESMQIMKTSELIEDIDVGNEEDDEDEELDEEEEEEDDDEDEELDEEEDDEQIDLDHETTNTQNRQMFHLNSSNEQNKFINNSFNFSLDNSTSNKIENNDTNNNTILTDDAKENYYLNSNNTNNTNNTITSDENDDFNINTTNSNDLTTLFSTDFNKQLQQQQSNSHV